MGAVERVELLLGFEGSGVGGTVELLQARMERVELVNGERGGAGRVDGLGTRTSIFLAISRVWRASRRAASAFSCDLAP